MKGENMILAHISDLHLGKRLYDFSMLEDQRYILKEILRIVRQEKADGLLIAGDIYDKSVPSAEAVQLADEFLTQAAGLGIPVFLISGNHDSAPRLSFGAGFFKESGVHIAGTFDGEAKMVELQDEYGPVRIHLLPFLKPAVVRHATGKENIFTTQEAVETVIQQMQVDTSLRNVLVAHQFVTGAGRSDSEEVSVGGTENVDASVFADFDYTALGHIHMPQHIGRETLRYCGTPLKYSFSEEKKEKSVTIVELKEKGSITVREVALRPLRDMRSIRGAYMEVTDKASYTEENRMDDLRVILTDEQDIPGGMEKLRTIYPNLMRLEYDNARTRENRQISGTAEVQKKTENEIFGEFYIQMNNEPMSQSQTAFLEQLIRKIKEEPI